MCSLCTDFKTLTRKNRYIYKFIPVYSSKTRPKSGTKGVRPLLGRWVQNIDRSDEKGKQSHVSESADTILSWSYSSIYVRYPLD